MHQKEIALWGKITAGITHEMKNVLAIINESNGLIGDIMKAGKKAPVKYQDKIILALEKVSRQVNRGVEISNSLNKFAHSTDHTLASVNIDEVMSQAIFLVKRFAGQKQVELEMVKSERDINLYTDSFRLILTLTGIIYTILEKTGEVEKISLKPEAQEGFAKFEITLHAYPDRAITEIPGPDQFSVLDEALKDLGAEFQADGRGQFILRVPLK